ncbi:hypothetical protein N7532_011434 [Penicillium argentinense]|uniref:Uncharacterized protein n=1 Tax=Penicillium argentinense TaxID=1131581 RepID=A0A9W9EIM5_9EURO|nr:uncharacterized protein N7532_011434 [Penicillium argentinense]KAJ5082391.1 hypothetical protein N7532_011434 [Penicillium argentinense]
MESAPTIHIALFTSTELLTQPWLSDLTRMINASYLVMHTDKTRFSEDKIRLRSDSCLTEELGPDGFTAVAFASGEPDSPAEVVGTASMKLWKDDGLWRPHDDDFSDDSTEELVNDQVEEIFRGHACPGDYELTVVAIPPNPRFRGKGIAGRLIRVCEEELIRRRKLSGKDDTPARIMIRVAKENSGEYWLKQGFVTVGSQRCPEGFWDSAEAFTMWAMIRELGTK